LSPTEETALTPIRGHPPGLADWLDLITLLAEDEGVRDTELRRRDRAVGARVQASRDRPERWLVAWVAARRAERGGLGPASGRRTADAVRWSATLLGVAGLLLGASAALGALSFQPQGRINVVAVLGVLVGLPTLLLVLALLNALPARLRRALPLIGHEPEGGGWLQPARWALRALPQTSREALASVFARGQSMERLAAPVQRWGLLSASQGAAVAFQIGALSTTLVLVVFSDLSFGWSTTLRVDPADAHRIASALAAPWALLWPEAVPTAELIERTRFFRIAAQARPDVPPELYGQWWRFVVAAVTCYGLLPRLVYFGLARARLRRSLVRAMVDAPGARRLLRRMQDPLVETVAIGRAGGDGAAPDGAESARVENATPWPHAPVVVSWAEAIGSSGGDPLISAGGRCTPSEDLEAAARAAALAQQADRPVAVVVRAFEPPLLELLDFLAELRRRLGDGREIVVGLAHADRAHERIWHRRLAQMADPWLHYTTDVPAPAGPAPNDASSAAGQGSGESA